MNTKSRKGLDRLVRPEAGVDPEGDLAARPGSPITGDASDGPETLVLAWVQHASVPHDPHVVRPAVQPRVAGLVADHVAALMACHGYLPPIVVARRDGRLIPIDGLHQGNLIMVSFARLKPGAAARRLESFARFSKAST